MMTPLDLHDSDDDEDLILTTNYASYDNDADHGDEEDNQAKAVETSSIPSSSNSSVSSGGGSGNNNNRLPHFPNWLRSTGGGKAYDNVGTDSVGGDDNISIASDDSSTSNRSNSYASRANATSNGYSNVRARSNSIASSSNYSDTSGDDDNESNAVIEDDHSNTNEETMMVQDFHKRHSEHVPRESFRDEGMVTPFGQGHRHGATVYDDWGLPISNPNNFTEGRSLCRPWLVVINLVAISIVVGIILHGGPTMDYEKGGAAGRYRWYGQEIMEEPDTMWNPMGPALIGPIPDMHEVENRLVGFGHHVAMNEIGDRVAVARTSGVRDSPGEVYVYSWKSGLSRKHHHPPKPGRWIMEQVLKANLEGDEDIKFHTGQQHTPLVMSASGHRIAFTEGDHVFIFESLKKGTAWQQIAKVHPLDEEDEDMMTGLPNDNENQKFQEQVNAEISSPQEPSNPIADPVISGTDDGEVNLSVEVPTKEGSRSGDQDEEDDDEADDDDDDDDDDQVLQQQQDDHNRRLLVKSDWERGGDHFGKHLAFSHDGKKLAVMGYSRDKGGYIRIFQDEIEDIPQDGHDVIRHVFEPTPDIFLEEVGDSLALSGDGHRIAVGVATSDDLTGTGTHTGIVQVYGMRDYDEEWSRIGQPIFGDYAMEGFGGTLSLSEDGKVLAVGVAFGGGPVKVYESIELDPYGREFGWERRGQVLEGAGLKEHFGAKVSLNYDGSFLAVGAPGSPDLLEGEEPIDEETEEYLHGKACLYQYDSLADSWTSVGNATSAYEGDAFGYSIAISGEGDRVVVGAPFRIVEDEVNVGVVHIFEAEEV